MQSMRVKIKQFQGTVATRGLTLVANDPRHRKLEPGEIIEVREGEPWYDDVVRVLEREDSPLELTHREPTRPVIFTSQLTAKLTSPFKEPADDTEAEQMAAAMAAMAADVEKEQSAPQKKRAPRGKAPRASSRRLQVEKGEEPVEEV